MKAALRIGGFVALAAALAAGAFSYAGARTYRAASRLDLAGAVDDDTQMRVLDRMASSHAGEATAVAVRRVPNTSLVDVDVTASDPGAAAAVANAIARGYVEQSDAAARRAAAGQLEQVTRQATEQSAKVADLERRVDAQRTATADADAQRPLIASLSRDLAAAHAVRLAREALDQAVERARDPLTVSAVAEHPAVQEMTRRLAAIEQRQTIVLARYGEKHSDSIEANRRVAQAQAARADVARTVVEAIREDYDAAVTREQVLATELAAATTQTKGDLAGAAAAPSLEDALASARADADRLASQQRVLQAGLAGTTGGVHVVDRAVPPAAPDAPAAQWMWNLLMAAAVLFACAALADRRHLVVPALIRASKSRSSRHRHPYRRYYERRHDVEADADQADGAAARPLPIRKTA